MKNIKESEERFGKFIFRFLKYNIFIIILAIVLIILLFVLDQYSSLPTSVDTIKHIIWGSFAYSLSLLLFIIILYEIINTISYKIKNNTIILFSIFLALMSSIFISFYYEGSLKNQESDINSNLVGCCILFSANLFYFLYKRSKLKDNKTLERNS